MATAVIMPELGESVDEATVTKWLKAVGDEVKEFEPLLEVNTDKVDTEIPSPAAGTILRILASPEQVVQAGMTLAWIGAPDESPPDGGAEPLGAPESAPEMLAPAPSHKDRTRAAARSQRPGRDPRFGFVSPVVARMVSAHNLDLSAIPGTGKNGRITKLDVLAYLEAAPAPAISGLPGEVLKLTTMRKRIAEHMVMSVRTSPHVTTVMEADMSKVAAHRAVHKPVFARDGVKLTYTAYFTAAIASALKMHPLVNSSWGDDGIHLHRAIHVGMATALEGEGLIVPVIKDTDGLSLLGVARRINDLAARARAGRLLPDEVRGGTFTITNHGISGSLFAAPIINQPQCGILGVGMLQKRAVVIDDAIAIRLMVYITLTFDHRILDGATADYFLADVKKNLETWS